MNKNEIIERLWANPEDTSTDLATAVTADSALLAEQTAAREFNAWLKLGMNAVQADDTLRLKLLQIPADESSNASDDISIPPAAVAAASNDSVWRRAVPVAACLIMILGLVLYFQPDAKLELENELFAHIYSEERFLDSKADIPLIEVNARMEDAVGAHLQTTADTKKLDVTFSQDCWIAKQKALHLIIKGKTGPVNLIVIPSSVASSEFAISDDRFRGIVTPTTGGTLVVIGNKQEPIEEYRKLMSANLDWEY